MFFLASLASLLFSCSAFIFASSRFDRVQQKSWIVTFLTSLAMSTGSLPFLWDFLLSQDILAVNLRISFSQVMCGSFQGFLLSDLLIGSIEYPQQLSLLLGWIHHIAYALLLPYVTSRGWAHIFCICLSMEIPTCLLASSFLWPRLRNDVLFASVFFFMRIGLHAILLVQSVLSRGRNEAFEGSFIPAYLLIAAFTLHATWFVSSVKSILLRTQAGDGIKAQVKGPPGSGEEHKSIKMASFGIQLFRPSEFLQSSVKSSEFQYPR